MRLRLGVVGSVVVTVVVAVGLTVLASRAARRPEPLTTEALALLAAGAVAAAGSARLAVTGVACLLVTRAPGGAPVPRIAARVASGAPLGWRRLVELAATGSTVAALLPTAAGARVPEVPVVRTDPAAVVVDTPVVRSPADPTPTSPPTTAAATAAPTPPESAPATTVRPPTTPPPNPRPPTGFPPPRRPVDRPDRALTTRVIGPGDHLWGVTRTVLTERLGRHPTTAEIVPLWRTVVTVNAPRLRSGDPDLVFPGERIIVPPSPDPQAHR